MIEMTLRIGWFTTARGPGSKGMFDNVATAIQSGALDANIEFVFSNRSPNESNNTDLFFNEVEKKKITLLTLSSKDFKKNYKLSLNQNGESLPQWREDYDIEINKLIDNQEYDIGILGGYMLIFSAAFCKKNYLLNLHPALPDGPTGTWQEVIIKLIKANSKISGMMMHQATKEVDRGPVATTCNFEIRNESNEHLWNQLLNYSGLMDNKEIQNSELFKSIRELGLAIEPKFILATLQSFANQTISVHNSQLSTNGLTLPIDLSSSM
jgi:folate-dependent phosphoribosylglycinamide formyltransferase PurN